MSNLNREDTLAVTVAQITMRKKRMTPYSIRILSKTTFTTLCQLKTILTTNPKTSISRSSLDYHLPMIYFLRTYNKTSCRMTSITRQVQWTNFHSRTIYSTVKTQSLTRTLGSLSQSRKRTKSQASWNNSRRHRPFSILNLCKWNS